MPPSRTRVLQVLGYSAAGWLLLALLRTSLRVAAIPRPPSEAAAVLGQVLLASLPWLPAAPVVVVLAERLAWTHGRRLRTLTAHLCGALTLSVIDTAWAWVVLPLAGYPLTLPPAVFYLVRLDQTLFLYLCLVGLGLGLRHRRRLEEAAARAGWIESRLLQARLHVLELQLHPHFLFNALNAVSELVHRDPPAARTVLASLRELLSRSLESGSGQEIPLREELGLLEPYLRIQRTRFAGSLEIVVAPDAATLDAHVPRLVLQPLVENAIRHGIARRTGPGRVTVSSRLEQDRLVLEVEDDGAGPSGVRREGLGLGNTRARLAQIHGEKASLSLSPGPGSGAIARLMCPLRLSPPPAVPDAEPEVLPAEAAAEERRLPLSRVLATLAAAWLLAALLGAHQDYAAAWLAGEPGSLAEALPARLLEAALWLGLTGPVVLVAARLARSSLGWPSLVACHVAVAIVVLVTHLALVRALSPSAMEPNLVATLLVNDLCVYAALAAGAHAWTVRESAATRLASAARLERELASARLELLRWRIRPDILFGALDRIGLLAERQPDRADDLTGRLGELLRLMLQRRNVAASQVELTQAYVEVESAVRSVA